MNIGDVAARSGLPAKTIRYYEEIGLIRPLRSDNGYRAFRDSDLHKLAFIGRARGLGFSIEECRKLLALYDDRQRASSDVKALAEDCRLITQVKNSGAANWRSLDTLLASGVEYECRTTVHWHLIDPPRLLLLAQRLQANGVQRFEGGAQGEHKMARALLPTPTHSAHWLAHPAFSEAVARFLEREKAGVENYLEALNQHSPLKQTQQPNL